MKHLQTILAAVAFGVAAQNAEAQSITPVDSILEAPVVELPGYAKCAVHEAKRFMPADHELSITRYWDSNQKFHYYQATLEKHDESHRQDLTLVWIDKGGKPYKDFWAIEFVADTYPKQGRPIIMSEVGFVQGYLGGIMGPLHDTYAESRIKDGPYKEQHPVMLPRIYDAILDRCDLRY